MPQFITMYLTESEDTANKILVPNLINFMILQQNLFVVCFLLGNSPASEVQTPRNYPKESIQHLEHGKSLK
jgi:hypothetical protein